MRAIVVGAGIAGASCAYHLQRDGCQTVLVDSAQPGRATDAGAGIVSALGARRTDADWDSFGAAAAAYYPTLAAELADLALPAHGWEPVGQLIAAVEEESVADVLDHAREVTGRHGPAGFGEPELLASVDIEQLWPGLRASSAVYLDRVARVDGRQFRDALVSGFERLGGEMRAGRAVLSGGVSARVAVDDVAVPADVVVAAAGAWTTQLVTPLGMLVEDAVRPQRGQLLHGQLHGSGGRPIVSTLDRHYLLTFPGDRIVFGATREVGAGFDPVVTIGGLAQVTNAVIRVAPPVAAARYVETRVGLRPQSVDDLPILGMVPGTNVYVATGLGHSGLTLGPHAGRVVAELVLKGEQAAYPKSFDVNRLMSSC